jgi:hypothetical protein
MKQKGLVVIAGGLLIIVPLVLLVWLRIRFEERLDVIHLAPSPIEVTVTERSDNEEQPVLLIATWGEPERIPAPTWSGTVTEVNLLPGSVVHEGDPLITVDGLDRLAAITESPLYRVLRRGDEGNDVLEAQELLIRLGHYNGEADGLFGSAMVAATRSLGADIGVDRPDGTLDPAWFIWFPKDGFEVATAHAAIGFPAPGPGESWIIGKAPLDRLRITGQDGGDVDLSGEWRLVIGEMTLIVVDGEIAEEDMSSLAGFLLESVPTTQDPDRTTTETQVAGTVDRYEPDLVIEVPVTAVVASAEGDLCVYRPDGGDYVAVGVEVGAGRTGIVQVQNGLQSGDEVLVNPVDVLADVSCH